MNKIVPSYAFETDGLRICVFSSHQPDTPVIYLHDMNGTGRQILHYLDRSAFSLVTITVPQDRWSDLLAPWPTPDGWPQYVACGCGAKPYLDTLGEKIIPEAESHLEPISWRGIAGYSLAGLFAIYAECLTPMFDRVASASGSLWYPGFKAWFEDHLPTRLPESVYFSCGSEEFNTTNPYLSPVRETTIALEKWFAAHKVQTTLQINPGDHYTQVMERTEAAVSWILDHPQKVAS